VSIDLLQYTTTTMPTLIIQSHTLLIDITIPKISYFDEKDYNIFTFQLKQALQYKRITYLLNIPSLTLSVEILVKATRVIYIE
jgi:hypothetical protein